jgi:dsDNA-specific endonuclease/ATPase MutS2
MKPGRYSVGDTVRVTTLEQTGVIKRALNNGRYEVAFGSFTTICAERDLTGTQKKTLPSSAHPNLHAYQKKPSVDQTIDLHGLTANDAEYALETWLNNLILRDGKQGRIIHGLGTGVVQRVTHAVLSRYAAVRAFKINPSNPGETLVYL